VKSVNHNAPHCVIFFTSKYSPEHPVIQHPELLWLKDTHPCESAGTILIFHVLIFRFLSRDVKIEDSDHDRTLYVSLIIKVTS
jgi:hypothetical protein